MQAYEGQAGYLWMSHILHRMDNAHHALTLHTMSLSKEIY